MNQLAQDLTAARAVIQDPTKWTQNVLARDINGNDKPSAHPLAQHIHWEGLEGNDPLACQWCALGAVQHVAGSDTLRFTDAQQALSRAALKLFGEIITKVNDDELKRFYNPHAAVLHVFDAAIEAAK